MAKFKSDVRALVLQDDEGVWARFAEHEFETDDKDVAARLRKVDGVTEVKSASKAADDGEENPPAKKAAAKKPAASDK